MTKLRFHLVKKATHSSDLVTFQLQNLPQINSVKQITHSVCLNHLSGTKQNQMIPRKIANTWCLIYSLFKIHLVK